MVEFKKREDVENWLDARPEETRRAEAIVLAARAALRVLPVVAQLKKRRAISVKNRSAIVLPVFRAVAWAWTTAQYPGVTLESRFNDLIDDLLGHAFEAVGITDRSQTFHQLYCFTDLAAESAYTTIEYKRLANVIYAVGENGDIDNLAKDAAQIEKNVSPQALAAMPLWLDGAPKWALDNWALLKSSLLGGDERLKAEDWRVWTDWYQARLDGTSPWSESVEIERVLGLTHGDWKAGPEVANRKLREIMGGGPAAGEDEPPNAEPEPEESSSQFEIGEDGLKRKPASAHADDFDRTEQQAFLDRLRKLWPSLSAMTQKVANQHPGLASVVNEYATEITKPLDELDLIALWSIGSGLVANSEAFARAADNRTMTEPLEAAHQALLEQAAQIHSAFILGFPKGREYTERADRERMNGAGAGASRDAARTLLDRFRNAYQFIEERTRHYFDAIEQSVFEPGWTAARTGFVAYGHVRNALIAIGRHVNKANTAMGTVAGGFVISQVDPQYQYALQAARFLLENAQLVSTFAAPYPELRVWLGSILEQLAREKQDGE